jgi:hypothetical protein
MLAIWKILPSFERLAMPTWNDEWNGDFDVRSGLAGEHGGGIGSDVVAGDGE